MGPAVFDHLRAGSERGDGHVERPVGDLEALQLLPLLDRAPVQGAYPGGEAEHREDASGRQPSAQLGLRVKRIVERLIDPGNQPIPTEPLDNVDLRLRQAGMCGEPPSHRLDLRPDV